MRLMPGISSPLANRSAADIDMICVRENSEGEYCGMGGRLHGGTPYELAEQTGIFTRQGIERIARYAFKLAQTRPRKMLASATKSNALQHAMVLWDEVVADVAKEFPDVKLTKYHVDALCARMVTHPHTLDVIVASNLFGDILTDIGSAISGSLGVGPGGNINPERTTPSMFEPIHGSAPDIAGKGIANPIAAIWAGAMMVDHLGETKTEARILAAIEGVLADERVKTPDLGGKATTADMTQRRSPRARRRPAGVGTPHSRRCAASHARSRRPRGSVGRPTRRGSARAGEPPFERALAAANEPPASAQPDRQPPWRGDPRALLQRRPRDARSQYQVGFQERRLRARRHRHPPAADSRRGDAHCDLVPRAEERSRRRPSRPSRSKTC